MEPQSNHHFGMNGVAIQLEEISNRALSALQMEGQSAFGSSTGYNHNEHIV